MIFKGRPAAVQGQAADVMFLVPDGAKAVFFAVGPMKVVDGGSLGYPPAGQDYKDLCFYFKCLTLGLLHSL